MQADLRAGRLSFTAGPFGLGPGKPSLQVDGRPVALRAEKFAKGKLVWRGAGGLELTQHITAETKQRLRVTSELRNSSAQARVLNQVILFAAAKLELGPTPDAVRILEQSAYLARVRTPRQMLTGSDKLKALDGTMGAFASETHALFYNPAERAGLLIGFETVDRWLPKIVGRMFAEVGRSLSGADNVDGGAATAAAASTTAAGEKKVPRFRSFTIGFDGGDLAIAPGETVALGDFVLEHGGDPLALLGAHGDRIKKINRFPTPPKPFANWCSWYPYRLGVTEERVLATARVARARHLDQLGLRIVQLDLGWEKGNLPTSFEENERFSSGLGWLSGELRREGFRLGVWVGVLCIADTHPVAREHPEWLLCGEDGKPRNNYNWFWAPFCPCYALDVTHSGAQGWLRENFTALARKGVRFVKWDFAGVVTIKEARGRHDPRMLSSGAREAVRTAFRIAQEALDSQGEKSLMIDCSAVDLAAAGIAGLTYAVMDTGNTGLGWRHLREVYTSYACHLFKQRWALLQPSCLLAGLPGTLEEARIRATATFMGAGHVDLGDDLTKLPEDRWPVLLATLPPNETPATPIDLFHPIRTGTLPYLTLVKGQPDEPPREGEPQGACVWVLPVRADWDEWTLVAVFNWDEPAVEVGSGVNLARRFQMEFTRLGLPARGKFWAHEFWSGQFLGEIPRATLPAGTYRHPGDFNDPIMASGPGILDLGFHGPAVKLLVLRRPRAHPWPVGTSFHQSGGRELSEVRWGAAKRTLTGKLHRPPGETGYIMIAVPGAEGAVEVRKFSLTATADVTGWSVIL